MGKVIAGATAILSVAAVAATINATNTARLPETSIADNVIFFFVVTIALGMGALVFEIGKLVGPQEERRS
jgi:hypothetical protein